MKSSAQQQIHVAWMMSQSHGKAIDFASHSRRSGVYLVNG